MRAPPRSTPRSLAVRYGTAANTATKYQRECSVRRDRDDLILGSAELRPRRWSLLNAARLSNGGGRRQLESSQRDDGTMGAYSGACGRRTQHNTPLWRSLSATNDAIATAFRYTGTPAAPRNACVDCFRNSRRALDNESMDPKGQRNRAPRSTVVFFTMALRALSPEV